MEMRCGYGGCASPPLLRPIFVADPYLEEGSEIGNSSVALRIEKSVAPR